MGMKTITEAYQSAIAVEGKRAIEYMRKAIDAPTEPAYRTNELLAYWTIQNARRIARWYQERYQSDLT